MKKFINDVENVESEMLDGMCLAEPDKVRRLEDSNVIVRAKKKEGKVAVISGGGSGHEPAHGGFVGTGMLDAAVPGPVYTSPTPDEILKAIEAVDAGKGVFMVIKNYTGDVMNFEMAGEMADGVEIAQVVTNDDVAVEDSLYTTGRRGVAGTIFVHKIAGAAAEAGKSLAEVKAVADKVVANTRSMGVALKPSTVPAAGKPGFELGEDEMELGIGIHGEPGTSREKLQPADAIVDHLLDKIMNDDVDYTDGSEVAVIINGSGGTPLMELYILNKRVHDVLAGKGVKIAKTYVGNIMTSLDMAGASISLCKLDDEMKALLLAPADTVAFTQD
ncbi:dihydroxyacetone kinase, DhaK subunit [Pseudoramibacter alactolyticus ATCC 23263]|uniref:phosphoenolpyruvate--glycerone phosphotransferase n=1 Tax=Pseudoramibacter alactolyticus ATCC 23263 TaxID=887929 RepID=E6MJW8_9FIRM|nr:dihydroxyacetone kinase subunit DhaK [Pseudoramibacter alactolyticus]EFV00487.1 dihydroxyacetone kinase, DhaK subunit [Pseudoramibacter alactolyticus ATCC 23263]